MSNKYQIDFGGKIRQLLSGWNEDVLGLNVLHQASQSFHYINLLNKSIEKSLELPLKQNFSLKAFDEEALVLVSFSEDNNPDLQDISRYSWNSDQATFYYPSASVLAIDTKMASIRHPRVQNQRILIDLIYPDKATKDYVFNPETLEIKHPRSYEVSREYFDWFVKLLTPYGVKPELLCEHMLWNDMHWVSTYNKEQKGLANYLYQLNRNGELLESFLLGEELKGISRDTFFTIKNRLIFVSQNSLLHVLEV